MLYCVFDLLFFIVVKSHLIIERMRMRMRTLCLIFLSVLSSNISAKTALPNAICQPDDKENICQFVIDKDNVIKIMINGTITRIAMMNNKPVSESDYENLLSQRGNCRNLSATGDYDEFNFYITDTYCPE